MKRTNVRMRRRSYVGGVVLLALASLAPPAAYASRSRTTDPRLPVVPRTLVLEGDASGSVVVRIPRPTVVDTSLWFRRWAGPNDHTRIVGEGSFTGIAIAPAGEPAHREDPVIVLGRFNGCSYGCAEARRVNYTIPFVDRTKIAAGTYRIYLMVGDDGGRVRVTFLRGRRGKLTLTPRSPIAFDAAVPAATSTSTPYAVSAGSDYSLGGLGIRFSVLDVALSDRGSTSSMGTCLHESTDATPEESKFQPGCPAGGPAERRAYPLAPEGRRFYYQDYQPIYEAGAWSFGAWHQSSLTVESAVQAGVFLTL